MNVSFLTSGHEPYDDRIYYHMATSLSDRGWNVEIVSSKIELKIIDEGISLNCFFGDRLRKRDKIKSFTDRLIPFNPDVIICSEPLTIIAAKIYSKSRNNKTKVVYDITEWYPSKRNLEGHYLLTQLFLSARLLMFNLVASAKSDAFIFGEWYKSRPYRFLFPHKPYVDLSYYPDSKYIKKLEPSLGENRLRLSYSGRMSPEKGFSRFLKVLNALAQSHKEYIIEAKIIGWYETKMDKDKGEALIGRLNENISIVFYERQSLMDFIGLIRDTDIFLDLRTADFENKRCLPIKLFYYAALGRPVLFTDLKAIHREVEIQKFGYLVNPGDTEQIVRIIDQYLNDKELYYNHCSNALGLFETNYNWKKIEPKLFNFINEISSY